MLHIHEEAERCLLCLNAPCGELTARAIRAIRFDNAQNAWRFWADCSEDDLWAAEQACIHYDRPIRIAELRAAVDTHYPHSDNNDTPLPSLEINFCDIVCENPFFLASSAICTNYEMVARALEAGWAGVFYKTISKQDIREVSPRFDVLSDSNKEQTARGEWIGLRNMEQLSENPYQVDFDILHRLKQNYPSKIIIASIMGQTEEEWIELAQMAQKAGCDAVELNFSCPQMRLTGLGSDIGQNPELILFYTSYVKNAVSIPVIPKMTPNVMSMVQPALACFYAGAHGISAINTIKSITMNEEASVSGKKTISGYSGKAVKPIALRMIHEMTNHPILRKAGVEQHMDISGIGGIQTWHDALDFIQLGCRNVQVCTSVMEYGYRIIDDLILGLQTYMQSRGITELKKLVGEQLPHITQPSELDRETMVFPKINRELCIGCGRCYISCQDGGHQAIEFGEERKPKIIGTKCVGCHLCRLVCPTGAIGMANRMPKPQKK